MTEDPWEMNESVMYIFTQSYIEMAINRLSDQICGVV